MEIDNKYAPLIHTNASLLLRPKTGLNDMVVEVVVNGHRLPLPNLFTDTVNAAPYLHPGTNTISVRIDTTLNNRVPGHASTPSGLTSVTLSRDGQTPLGG